MKKQLKQSISIALLAAIGFASASSLQPRPARAVVGLFTGNPATLITGGALLGAGALAIGANMALCWNRRCEGMGGALLALVLGVPGFFVGVSGIIVLDGGNVEFGQLTSAQARQAGITAAELASYNDELAEINAVFQDQLKDRKAEFEQTGTITLANSMADWQEAGQALSSEAFSAVKKLSASLIKKANAAITKS